MGIINNNNTQHLLMWESFFFVGLNTQYRGIDDPPKEKAYQINNWMILHTIGDTFNGC